ncbi:uncharacterized protein LOC119991793 [Tripterygium wilfordii]|uniref:uncharacterized protein LOC119991793 n=1 Tax=Tripterygium wilfordii TaxID=458696 RepID=UPI0018F85D6F|nr:uncharacterized protein LOC119991793 [Tripterygium wilfordii]
MIHSNMFFGSLEAYVFWERPVCSLRLFCMALTLSVVQSRGPITDYLREEFQLKYLIEGNDSGFENVYKLRQTHIAFGNLKSFVYLISKSLLEGDTWLCSKAECLKIDFGECNFLWETLQQYVQFLGLFLGRSTCQCQVFHGVLCDQRVP